MLDTYQTLGSIRHKQAPKRTKKAYKLFKVDSLGNPCPLFIDSNATLPLGVWLDADSPQLNDLQNLDCGSYLVDMSGNAKLLAKEPTATQIAQLAKKANGSRFMYVSYGSRGEKMFYNYGINGSGSKAKFALRAGWHICNVPTARHIGKGKSKIYPNESEYRRNNEYWFEIEYSADINYNNLLEVTKWRAGGLPNIPTDGYYEFATNTNADKKVKWIIAGAIRIVRRLTDSEAEQICISKGVKPDLPRENEEKNNLNNIFLGNITNTMITEKNVLTEYPKQRDIIDKNKLAILDRIFNDMPKYLEINKTINTFCDKVNALIPKTEKPKKEPKTKKVKSVRFTEQDLYDFVSIDSVNRPIMCGVYHDNGYLIASDGRILARIKAEYPEELEGKITISGKEILGKYPDYKPLLDIPPDYHAKTVDFKHLLASCKQYNKVIKNLEKGNPINYVKIDDVFFDVDLLIRVCKLAIRIGATEIHLTNKLKGNIISSGENTLIIMPLKIEGIEFSYLDYNTNKFIFYGNDSISRLQKDIEFLKVQLNSAHTHKDIKNITTKINNLENTIKIINEFNNGLNGLDSTETKKTTTALSVMVFGNCTYRPSKEFTSCYKRRDTTARFRLVTWRGVQLHGTNINKNINKTKLFNLISRLKSNESFSAKNFIDELGNCFPQEIARMRGSKRYNKSKYQLIEIGGVAILLRVSDHNINCNNVIDDIEEAYSIVIKEAKKHNTFKANDLSVTEYVYLESNLNKERYLNILESIINLSETGEYYDLANADFVNYSPLEYENKVNEISNKKISSSKNLEGLYDYYTLFDKDFNELKDFGRNKNLHTIKKEAKDFLEQHNLESAYLQISDVLSDNIKDTITINNSKATNINPLGFVPISHKEKIKTYKLGGELGKFIGEYDRCCFSIVLRGDKGAGKSRLLYQLINAFAYKNLKIGFFSLEMGLKSSVTQRYKSEYITPRNLSYINISSTVPTYEQLSEACKKFDVVAIDSWTKLQGFEQQDFDRLQKENPNTILLCIFQSTTGKVTRGGNMPEFDGGIVIHVHKGGIAECEKNRYADTQNKYSVFERTLIENED